MGRYIAIMLLVMGAILLMIGVGADVLLGGSPGLSLPQLMLIMGGIGLVLAGGVLWQERWRATLRRHLLRVLLGGGLVLVVMLLVFELLLAVIGFAPRYGLSVPATFLTPVDWWVCDALGCRYAAEKRAATCLPDEVAQNRGCRANPQGFPDDDNFTADTLPADEYRILALGDSFSYGGSATAGNSYIERLEADLPATTIWNTGIPGAGTNQAVVLFEEYAPIMQPDLVLLGFYSNDFEDNVYPLDSYAFGTTADGNLLGIRQYRLHDDGSVTRIETQADFFYRYHRLEMPDSPWQVVVGSTRVGTLLLNTLDAIRNIARQRGAYWDVQVNATRTYLTTLRDEAATRQIPLLVLLIPDRGSLAQPTPEYQMAQQLLRELRIPYIDPYAQLTTNDYAVPPDDHWNDAGHGIAAAMLQACIVQLQAGAATCDSAP